MIGHLPECCGVPSREDIKIELFDIVEEFRAEARYLESLANDLERGLRDLISLKAK